MSPRPSSAECEEMAMQTQVSIRWYARALAHWHTDSLVRFGASLSYASHDGIYGVETPQVLGHAMIRGKSEAVTLTIAAMMSRRPKSSVMQ